MRVPVLSLTAVLFARTAIPQAVPIKMPVVVCAEPSNCSHRFENGELLKTMSGPDGISVTAALDESKNSKYFRLRVGVANNSTRTFDLVPEAFLLEATWNKLKTLKPIAPEDVEKAVARAAFWSNFMTTLSAHMARDTVSTTSTTQTQTSGTVRTSSPDGAITSGTYTGNGTSVTTSQTSLPDYEARAKAAQAVRERNELVAAQNAQVAETALRDNTLIPGQAIGGLVYFKSTNAEAVRARIVVDGTEYDFEF